MLDLQKFADENSETEKIYGDVLDGAEEVDDNSEIPADFEGIPENIAREVMQESAAENSGENSTEAEKPAEKPVENPATDNVTIPYARFKEVNDKKNESEKLLAAYRERYGDLNSQAQTPPPQNSFQTQAQPIQTPPQFQPPSIDENFTKQIDEAIKQTAMQMSGLSKEDVDALDYLDDDDPKIARWNHSKKISEAAIYNDIVQRQMLQQQELQRAAMLRDQTISNYNNFVARQQAADNFSAVQQFAENEFFNAQSDIDKQIIQESYARVSNNTASPADVMVVQNYFSMAKSAFENRQAPQIQPQPKPKTKPAANNFPRTNQVSGTTGGGGISQAALAEMLQNKDWNKIPPNYQKILLGL